jgi:hypothetical protein
MGLSDPFAPYIGNLIRGGRCTHPEQKPDRARNLDGDSDSSLHILLMASWKLRWRYVYTIVLGTDSFERKVPAKRPNEGREAWIR